LTRTRRRWPLWGSGRLCRVSPRSAGPCSAWTPTPSMSGSGRGRCGASPPTGSRRRIAVDGKTLRGSATPADPRRHLRRRPIPDPHRHGPQGDGRPMQPRHHHPAPDRNHQHHRSPTPPRPPTRPPATNDHDLPTTLPRPWAGGGTAGDAVQVRSQRIIPKSGRACNCQDPDAAVSDRSQKKFTIASAPLSTNCPPVPAPCDTSRPVETYRTAADLRKCHPTARQELLRHQFHSARNEQVIGSIPIGGSTSDQGPYAGRRS
jgi:hypothetical protein